MLLCIFSDISHADTTDCEESRLVTPGDENFIFVTHGIGYYNGQDQSSYNWLFNNESSSTEQHPHIKRGVLCDFVISVNNRSGVQFDTSHYIKNHFDNDNEINFRFILSTKNLIESFVDGDKIVLYKFDAIDNQGENRKLLKVRLFKHKDEQWILKFQWFNLIEGESVFESFVFNSRDKFIDFSFLWKITNTESSDGSVQITKSQAAVVIRKGAGENPKPNYILSPYTYEPYTPTSGLMGTSYLGYINANSNFLDIGDEIRIYAPKRYN